MGAKAILSASGLAPGMARSHKWSRCALISSISKPCNDQGALAMPSLYLPSKSDELAYNFVGMRSDQCQELANWNWHVLAVRLSWIHAHVARSGKIYTTFT